MCSAAYCFDCCDFKNIAMNLSLFHSCSYIRDFWIMQRWKRIWNYPYFLFYTHPVVSARIMIKNWKLKSRWRNIAGIFVIWDQIIELRHIFLKIKNVIFSSTILNKPPPYKNSFLNLIFLFIHAGGYL